MLLETCLLLCLIGIIIYLSWTAKYSYWKDRGFPYLEAKFPFGNLKGMVVFDKYFGYIMQDLYKKTAGKSCVGLFNLRRPMLLIRDPELIKCVMVKDFTHFRDRFNERKTGPLGDHLFALGGDRWRALRIKLAPTFTSGKMKTMFSLFQVCANQLDKLLGEKTKNKEGVAIDVKDLVARFTTDIIGSCAFGLNINSMMDPNNEFRRIGMKVFPKVLPVFSRIKAALLSTFMFLEKFIPFSFLDNEVSVFITSVVKDTVKYREKNNEKRNDFLDLLIELKNKGKIEMGETDDRDRDLFQSGGESAAAPSIELTVDLLISQCFVFFVAGFETSSSVQSFCMYELAINQDIQKRLRKEIDETIAKHGEITYQAIQEMSYLDQVVSETMRKYPTLPILMRSCTKNYNIPDTPLVVEKGTRVLIPTYALHHDPEYFPDPEKFDPDRFSPERKSSIHPYTYLPFGEGPRLCIGMRFGLLQTKTGIATIISKYAIETCRETQIPIKLVPSPLITSVDGPITLLIKTREDL